MRKLVCMSVLILGALALFAGASALSAQTPDGQAVYIKHCKNCHGPVGGEPTAAMKARMNPPALFDPAFLAKTDDAKFMESMEKGGKKMRPMGSKMTKAEMEAVMKFVRGYGKGSEK